MTLPLFVPGGPGPLELLLVLVVQLAILVAVVGGAVMLATRLLASQGKNSLEAENEVLTDRVAELEREVEDLRRDDE